VRNSLTVTRIAVAACVVFTVGNAHARRPPKGPVGWEARLGWSGHRAPKKGAPVVLLVHGLAASSKHWKAPHTSWSLRNIYFDPKKEPKDKTLSLSPPAPRRNFFDFFVAEGMSVYTWNQAPCIAASSLPGAACRESDTFDKAYESARWALRKILDETDGPIALVGHSRGGLVIRRLLKEYGTSGRIRWVVTLHSPHHGTSIAGRPAKLESEVDALISLAPKELAEPVLAAKAFFMGSLGVAGGRELAATGKGSIIPGLAAGEKAIPGVQYVSFGGTSPIVLRVYVLGEERLAFPEIDLFDELKPGGDALVTDASAHFFFPSLHFSRALHHGEVLWNRAVMEQVRDVIRNRYAGGRLVNARTGLCLTAVGSNVELARCSSRSEQRWHLRSDGTSLGLENEKAKECVVAGPALKSHAQVVIRTCDPVAQVKAPTPRGARALLVALKALAWQIVGTGERQLELHQAGMCLAAEGRRKVRLHPCDGSQAQRWTWKP